MRVVKELIDKYGKERNEVGRKRSVRVIIGEFVASLWIPELPGWKASGKKIQLSQGCRGGRRES